MASKAKRSNLIETEKSFLANCPQKIIGAYNDLVTEGVNPVALVRLIKNRTLATGRPRKTDHDARLQFSVDCYKQEHPGVSDKAAIQGVLSRSDDYNRLSGAEQKAFLRKLQTAYSRRQSQKPR